MVLCGCVEMTDDHIALGQNLMRKLPHQEQRGFVGASGASGGLTKPLNVEEAHENTSIQ